MGFISKLFSGGVGTLVNSIGNTLDKVVTTKEEKLNIELEMKKADLAYAKDTANILLKEKDLYIGDVASARQMASTVQQSKNASFLSKNINPLLALGTVVLTFFIFYMVLFSNRDFGENQEIVFYVLGALSAIVTQVFSFYFGSSQGSKDKHDLIDKIKTSSTGDQSQPGEEKRQPKSS